MLPNLGGVTPPGLWVTLKAIGDGSRAGGGGMEIDEWDARSSRLSPRNSPQGDAELTNKQARLKFAAPEVVTAARSGCRPEGLEGIHSHIHQKKAMQADVLQHL